MKHLKKFEELNYSTYMSAADKIEDLGQKEKADEIRKHAKSQANKGIEMMTFGILVGGVREFPNAKFESLNVTKLPTLYILNTVFKSDNNTHQINCVIGTDGSIRWESGNKFSNRKSVNDFSKLIKILAKSNEQLINFVENNGLTPEDLRLEARTFYI